MNRRNFLKGAVISAVATTTSTSCADFSKRMASLIDLSICDGCAGEKIPFCVAACREKNEPNFPVPQKPIMDYWPQTKHEDYSDKKYVINRLTPYNWTYIESVEVGGERIFIPRRCMHCDNPSCQKICPFGIIAKSDEGAVSIDEKFCFGGAKCRSVCPWHIPQRQGGVGLYLKVAPKLAGGGVMYKCDMCADLLAKGQKPACESKCSKGAIKFGKKDEIIATAKARASEIGGYLYGLDENGGTATIYISKAPFEKINEAIVKKHGLDKNPEKKGTPHMEVGIQNPMQKSENLAAAALIAPVAGVIGGVIAAYKVVKNANK